MKAADKFQAQAEDDTPVKADPSAVLFLSLFLLLLAFFILLNALSNLDKKKITEVMSSFTKPEESSDVEQQSANASAEEITVTSSENQVLDSLEILFANTIPLVKAENSYLGKRLMVELPYKEIFVGTGQTVRADRKRVLQSLSPILSNEYVRNFRMRMRVTLFTKNLYDDSGASIVRGEDLRRPIEGRTQYLDSQAALRGDLIDIQPEVTGLSIATGSDRNADFLRLLSLYNALIESGIPATSTRMSLREAGENQEETLRLRFFIEGVGVPGLALEGLEKKLITGVSASPASTQPRPSIIPQINIEDLNEDINIEAQINTEGRIDGN